MFDFRGSSLLMSDVGNFESLLLGTLSQDNIQRISSECYMDAIKEGNYLTFLNLLIIPLIKSENPNTTMIALFRISHEVKTNKNFMNDEVIGQVSEPLVSSFVSLLQTDGLNQTSLNFMAIILGGIGISRPDLNIHGILFQWFHSFMKYQSFIIKTLSKIISHHFKDEYLSDLISLIQYNNTANTEERFEMLLIIASFVPYNQELHQMFDGFMINISADNIIGFLSILVDMIKPSCAFLAEHQDNMVNYLISIAENSNFEQSMIIISLYILTKFIILLQKQRLLKHESLTATMIELVKFMDDPDSIYYDDVCMRFHKVCNNTNHELIIDILKNIRDQYNPICLLSAASQLGQNVLLHMIQHVNRICVDVCSYITTEQSVEVRTVAYRTLDYFINEFGLNFVEDDNFPVLCQTLIGFVPSESENNARDAGFQCLNSFLSRTNFSEDDVSQVLCVLINNINPPNIHVLQCFSSIAKNAGSQILKFSDTIFQAINQYFYFQQIELDLEIFRIVASLVNQMKSEISDMSIFTQYFERAVQTQQINDEYSNEMICLLLPVMPEVSIPFLDQFIPKCIQVANQELTICSFSILDGITSISGFTQLKSKDHDFKSFVNESQLSQIVSSLLVIESCLKHLGQNFEEYFQDCFITIKHWITLQCNIQKIHELCYLMFDDFINMELVKNDKVQIVDMIVNSFLLIPEIKMKYLKTLIAALSLGIWENEEMEMKLFATIANLVTNKEEFCSFDCEEKIIILFFEQFQTLFLPFFSENLLEFHLIAVEENDFPLPVLLKYIQSSKDFTLFEEYNRVLMNHYEEMSDIAATMIGEICTSFDLTAEYIELYYNALSKTLKNKDSFENDELVFLSASIVSFTKLMNTYGEQLNAEESARIWINALPPPYLSEDINIIALFLLHRIDLISPFVAARQLKVILNGIISNRYINEDIKELLSQMLLKVVTQYQDECDGEYNESEWITE